MINLYSFERCKHGFESIKVIQHIGKVKDKNLAVFSVDEITWNKILYSFLTKT